MRSIDRRRIGGAVALAVLMLLAVFWPREPEQEPVGVFSRGYSHIRQGERISKLLVVKGSAVVEGEVAVWMAVIEGDLQVRSGGKVSGAVLVLHGQASAEAGASLSPWLLVVVPPGSPLFGALKWLLALGVLAVSLLTGIAGWLAASRLRRTRIYTRLRRKIIVYLGRQPWLLSLAGLAGSGFFLALFLHLTEETIFQQEADLFDNIVIWLVRLFADPMLDKVMVAITQLGSGYAYAAIAPAALAVLYYLRRRQEGLWLATCLAGGVLLNFLLKNMFLRARPDLFQLVSAAGYSFPSGHAMVSLCFYGMLAYIAGRHLASRGKRLLLYGLTALMLAAIGFSRIYLGVHYPSDVVAGYMAGGTWLAFCMAGLWWREHKRQMKKNEG